MLAHKSISSVEKRDINKILDYLCSRKDLLKLLFAVSASKIRKYHIPSMFLQLIVAGVVVVIYSPRDKMFPMRLNIDSNGVSLYQDITNLRGMTIVNDNL